MLINSSGESDQLQRLTGDGVDVVFESIGGKHIWESRNALRPGGVVVAYGLTGSLEGGRLASGRAPRRNRFHAIKTFAPYLIGSWILPSRRRVVPYSIQTLERLKPAWFKEDLGALFDLLKQGKIRPVIAQRFPLAEARRAQEILGKGGVTGKFVLVCNEGRLVS